MFKLYKVIITKHFDYSALLIIKYNAYISVSVYMVYYIPTLYTLIHLKQLRDAYKLYKFKVNILLFFCIRTVYNNI